jgi:hypothetical protein
MRNPGYVYELAVILLNEDEPTARLLAGIHSVEQGDVDVAMRALRPLNDDARDDLIHGLYVKDARDKGYAVGDPEKETSWVLGQRAQNYYGTL